MKKKNVCLDARKIDDGGIGTYIQNILKNFDRLDFQLTLILSSTAVERYPELCRKFKVVVCHASPYSIQEQLVLTKMIPKCDVFWSPHFNVPLFPIRARKRLVTIHDVFHLSPVAKLSLLEKCCAKAIISQAVRRSHHIITVSQFSRSEILSFTSAQEEKITVIPIGVNQEHFSDRPTDVRSKYNLPNRYFLFVGNQKGHKNLKGVCKALSHLLEHCDSDPYLVLVGSGAGLRYVDDLAGLVRECPRIKGKVIPMGYVSIQDLPLLYQNAVSLVFPSFYEGFGLPPLEAMSSGCPVIASRIGSIAEVCADAVYYVDPYDFRDISKGMARIWQSERLRNNLIQKGKEHIKKFNWKTVADQHRELISLL